MASGFVDELTPYQLSLRCFNKRFVSDPVNDLAEVVEPLVFPELLIAAGLFYAGYSIGTPLDSIASSLRNVDSAIQDIKPKIEHTLQKINDIIDTLNRLLEQLEFIIKREYILENLGHLQGIQDSLGGYLQKDANGVFDEKFFMDNRFQFNELTDEIPGYVNALMNHAGPGPGSLLFGAPFIATWAQAKSMFLRTGRSTWTIWDHPFHARMFKFQSELFRQVEHNGPILADQLRNLPHAKNEFFCKFDGTTYSVTNSNKQGTTEYVRDFLASYSPTPDVLRGVAKVWVGGQWRFQLLPANTPSQPSVHWLNRPSIEKASQCWPLTQLQIRSIETHGEFFKESQPVSKQITESMTKPAGWSNLKS